MANFQSSTRDSTFVFVLDVEHGNMVLIRTASGHSIMFDCNVTDENKTRVLREVSCALEDIRHIDCFICSHRDADHIRGIKNVNEHFPIRKIIDSGHQGTTENSKEYIDYMNLRERVVFEVAERCDECSFGETNLHILSASDCRLKQTSNEQGIVLQVEYPSSAYLNESTRVILPGDCSGDTWKNAILNDHTYVRIRSQILMAAHHGSRTFFEVSGQTERYTEHINWISPEVVIVSVGPNGYEHPHTDAMALYKQHSSGDGFGSHVESTQVRGSMAIRLRNTGQYTIDRIGTCR